MIGFKVALHDGTSKVVEADGYIVEEGGGLAISGGGTEVLNLSPGEWIMIDTIGTRLADVWPPDNLGPVVYSAAEILGVRFGHYVHELRDSVRFEDWRMNDLDALCAALLAAVSIDPTDSARRREMGEIRDVVSRHFEVAAGD